MTRLQNLQDRCTAVRLTLDVMSASAALSLARACAEQSPLPEARVELVRVFVAWGQATSCTDDIARLPWTYEVQAQHLIAVLL
jgi:hypothetical protein